MRLQLREGVLALTWVVLAWLLVLGGVGLSACNHSIGVVLEHEGLDAVVVAFAGVVSDGHPYAVLVGVQSFHSRRSSALAPAHLALVLALIHALAVVLAVALDDS